MGISAKVSSVNRVGDGVSIQCSFSDGTMKEYQFTLPLDLNSAKAAVKEDIDRLNTIDGQITTLKALIGTEIK
jgi:hypothetical protein